MTCIRLTLSVLLGTSIVLAQSERSMISDGNRQYRDKKYADAEANYRKALEKNKELQQGAFNLGDALYKQERFNEAVDQYNAATSRASDAKTKSQAYHNLGNALLKNQKLPESIAAYKDALKLNPGDEDTKYNLEYAKALLKQQQNQQKQNKDQKSDDKQKQDQKNQQQQKQDQQKQDQQKQAKQDQQKQDNEKQGQKQQAQNDKQKDQKGQQVKKMQISKEDAERILEALKNEEKDVQKKLHKKAPARVKVDKDW